jgi:hypothetical protein
MNRYPVWKYAIIVIALLVGCSTPCPISLASACRAGVFGQGHRQGGRRHAQARGRGAGRRRPEGRGRQLEGNRSARFDTTDDQLKAKDALRRP